MAQGLAILITGGAGYIGGLLTRELLAQGCKVTVLDALHFGTSALDSVLGDAELRVVAGDVRDFRNVDRLLERGSFDVVIHLAAIANDPCADLDVALTESVNFDATAHLMRSSKAAGVRRFLYASSASVYGIKDSESVTEDLPLEPITAYARTKAAGEGVLNGLTDDSFCACSVRAATVCGYSPRLRLDLTVNLFVHQAIRLRKLRVFGGEQKRPNVHVDDLVRLYTRLIHAPRELINGSAFNLSVENASVRALAEQVREIVDADLALEIVPSQDARSYHLSSERVQRVLGFRTERTVSDAIRDVQRAFCEGRVQDAESDQYRNVAFMRNNVQRWKELVAWREL